MLSPITSTLLKQLRRDFGKVAFAEGETFVWSPQASVITFYPKAPQGAWLLLHEVAHSNLNHHQHTSDIELLRLEAEAWAHAREVLAPKYNLSIPDDFIEDCLDTYRNWLHARSLCPVCSQIGLQAQKNVYNCINCRHSWGVNDAKQCALRRTKLQSQSQLASLQFAELEQ